MPSNNFEGVSVGRHRNMVANRSKNTKPEKQVRSMLHRAGYRFCIHGTDLPGTPDLVFRARQIVVEVRGCFWHGHGCHPLGLLPKSRTDYWHPKIMKTRLRDIANTERLRALGWKVLTVWECEVRANHEAALRKLKRGLGPRRISR